MYRIFYYFGYKANDISLDLSEWNTSNVTNMSYAFYYAGYNADTFFVDVADWDTGNVTNMSYMFSRAGYNADYLLDLSSWNVGKVKSSSSFNAGVTSKVISPF
jgi:hypothetical protein